MSSDQIVPTGHRLLCVKCILVALGVKKVPSVAPEGLSIAGFDVVALWSLCRLDDCCWLPSAIFLLETDVQCWQRPGRSVIVWFLVLLTSFSPGSHCGLRGNMRL